MLDKFQNMSEDELGEFMGVIMSLITLIVKYMNPIRAGRVTKLALDESKKVKELSSLAVKSDKVEKGIEIGADIFAFRRKYPEDFDKVLDLAEELISKYDTDPKMKEKILSFFK